MSARSTAVAAVSIALVALFVMIVRIPVPATGGFWHMGVVAETFIAVAFGPLIGAVASGVGAALADTLSGYTSFAPLTLIAHGSTGLIVGWLGWRRGWTGMLLGWLFGGLAQVTVYFVGEATVYGFGAAGALAELPGNLVQVGLGLLGLLLFRQVRAAYPQIEHLASGQPVEEG
ncbi:MAG: ECF transporter S component [Anaerolineales bacterium]|nr:ECF transporter S component [Anaerolineales bacterium]